MTAVCDEHTAVSHLINKGFSYQVTCMQPDETTRQIRQTMPQRIHLTQESLLASSMAAPTLRPPLSRQPVSEQIPSPQLPYLHNLAAKRPFLCQLYSMQFETHIFFGTWPIRNHRFHSNLSIGSPVAPLSLFITTSSWLANSLRSFVNLIDQSRTQTSGRVFVGVAFLH